MQPAMDAGRGSYGARWVLPAQLQQMHLLVNADAAHWELGKSVGIRGLFA